MAPPSRSPTRATSSPPWPTPGTPGPGRLVVPSPTGWFYGVRSLAQLVTPDGAVAGVSVIDQAAAMPHPRAIEGFYGSPWTTRNASTSWPSTAGSSSTPTSTPPRTTPTTATAGASPTPPTSSTAWAELVDAAAAHHVRFTFAVLPGVSICYSDPADTGALVAKLQALHDLGVRTFAVALDDIVAERWNCAGDQAAYGPPSMEAAAPRRAPSWPTP